MTPEEWADQLFVKLCNTDTDWVDLLAQTIRAAVKEAVEAERKRANPRPARQ